MSLIENTLFGKINKVCKAIQRLQEYEPYEGYYLAFSGGKDSVVLYALAQMAEVKFDAHYNLTTVDPPELVKFIREQYPEVHIEKPKKSMWDLIVEKRMPPTRVVRYCCEHLKEKGGSGHLVATGIRKSESHARSQREMYEISITDTTKTFLNPIIDWKETDIWEFIKTYKIPYCKLYDEGLKRLGCVMCPMQGKNGMLNDAKRWPKIALKYKRTFDRSIKKRKKDGLDSLFENGEDMYDWWVYNPQKSKENDLILFE